MNTRLERPPVNISAQDQREHLSEVLDQIGHYVDIAQSCVAVRDDRMLAHALKMIALCAVGGAETSRSLLDAVAADKRLRDLCRSDSNGGPRG
ncbi:hypothetical protein [Methylobacterium radiotolerans]|uniref:Uncharacterized protein n=1 Tax=Methylobacterium radiotolerans (strain ATCC 27329 / DSM 1819 / JCM 2831 / NBRC 15690 / NCIMB 10815 / 0-1) TaxID=426355 RepID=B1M1E3_METRJ|nr:hypothetical protein [Methylobacterium radiotolerans]ACB26118.1 hypothetical protein Mrad2831_4149 [Methylobacterium radiotolerans JCM 2831]GEN01081.1 hypothetical protein MRA01_56200 [Methylobacterium radiotolerans]